MKVSRSRIEQTARAALLRASDVPRRATASLRLEPDFLIVGAQRCGTTSMFKTLAQHPSVAPPFLRKGVHYFDKNRDRDHLWYRSHFPVAATSRLRRSGARPITGESSPYYMFHPTAAARIADELPQVRLIALLRDPVERAYSSHSHESARGYETESFPRALELEDSRTSGEREAMLADPAYDSFSLQHHAYLARGRYVEQLRRLEGIVGRDRLLVVDSQDFFDSPEGVFPAVCRHLGLAPHEDISFERHNARGRSPMDAGLRRELEEHFAPFDDELASWWGRTPSWRR
ncbi:sulfotransferase [Pseudokineococcus marinus]|uniref:Sulfotransferase n=1 Tax=Pseudokineococcus marinus TaxID=351215 RepID=A0A849BLK4_9ACTN|nr:sulfotransferase [Pseudokineococcus marinus]NNH21682.1 sulfotransferase [Pseudokineococcus marinus]